MVLIDRLLEALHALLALKAPLQIIKAEHRPALLVQKVLIRMQQDKLHVNHVLKEHTTIPQDVHPLAQHVPRVIMLLMKALPHALLVQKVLIRMQQDKLHANHVLKEHTTIPQDVHPLAQHVPKVIMLLMKALPHALLAHQVKLQQRQVLHHAPNAPRPLRTISNTSSASPHALKAIS